MTLLRDDVEKREFWIGVMANITAVLIVAVVAAVLHGATHK